MKNYILQGLNKGILQEQLEKKITTDKVKELLNNIKCSINTSKVTGTFTDRLLKGNYWETYTLTRLQNKNPTITYTLTDGKNSKADIVASKGNKMLNIEVKSETASNVYKRLFIKAKQYNHTTNSWELSNLLSGNKSDVWIHYFLYNNSWHYMKTTKGELIGLCKDQGKEKLINLHTGNKAPQWGYLLDIEKLSFTPVDFTVTCNG